MSWVAVGTVVVSAVVADRQQKKVEKAQEEQAEIERAVQGEQTARARRAERAKAQVARAEIENVAGSVGQTQSSASIAGQGFVTAQSASNIGAINTASAEANILTSAAQDVADAGRIGLGERLIMQGGQIGGQVLGQQIGNKLA
jgi:hypothetical protein